MIVDALNATAELGIFPVIGLVLFFICFVAVVIWTFKLDNGLVDEMAHLPFEGERPSDRKGK